MSRCRRLPKPLSHQALRLRIPLPVAVAVWKRPCQNPPTIPMPVDLDSSLPSSAGNPAGTRPAGEGSASPFNEQNLSSLNNNEMESTVIESTIPTEHSGSTEL
ncbi:hypothetical protein MTO96_026982 [Rhipicephalus appendiculatus]